MDAKLYAKLLTTMFYGGFLLVIAFCVDTAVENHIYREKALASSTSFLIDQKGDCNIYTQKQNKVTTIDIVCVEK